MNISLEPGTYVVAVSGGLDSMALLHALQVTRAPDVRLVVAHLDHGIREDSAEDRRLVQSFSHENGLPFVYHEAGLTKASEAVARQARYDFLHQVRQHSNARAIITAHHLDDVLETAIHNILRGTGRLGLTSLKETDVVIRPLLHKTKQELRQYAESQGIKWREDSTNASTVYARNHIRHNILPRLSIDQKRQLWQHLQRAKELNHEIDHLLINHLHQQPAVTRLDRKEFIALPHSVAREVMAAWLRNNGVRVFHRRLLEQLVTAAKTLRVGKFISVDAQHSLSITKDELALLTKDR